MGVPKAFLYKKGAFDGRQSAARFLLRYDQVDAFLQGGGIQHANGIGHDTAVCINEIGGGDGAQFVLNGGNGLAVIEHREGIPLLGNEIGGDLHSLPGTVGQIHHEELNLVAIG